MFTQNYINLQIGLFKNRVVKFYYQDGTSGTGSYTIYSDAYKLGDVMGTPKCANPVDSGNSLSGSGLYFGSGSKPATKNDYTLESPIASGLSFSSGVTNVGKTKEGQYAAWVSHVVKNTSNDTINIYEIGLFTIAMVASSSYKSILVERTVLTEPIVIPAGDEKIITYKITFNQTLNVEA